MRGWGHFLLLLLHGGFRLRLGWGAGCCGYTIGSGAGSTLARQALAVTPRVRTAPH